MTRQLNVIEKEYFTEVSNQGSEPWEDVSDFLDTQSAGQGQQNDKSESEGSDSQRVIKLISQSLVTPYRERDRFTKLALVIENDLGD